MRELIGRYTYHGGPNEHKGPSDFNGGADDGSDDEADATPPPPQNEAIDSHMMPPHYPNQAAPQFAQFRHHTPSASPPIANGAFAQHAAASQATQRSHTPQPPQNASRPTSRNDMRRLSQNAQPPGPPQVHQVNGYAFIPHPAIYNPQAQQNMQPAMTQAGPQYPYAPPPTSHAPAPHMQQYVDERPSSLPPSFPSHGAQNNSLPPPSQVQQRHSVSPPQAQAQQLPQGIPRTSPPRPPSLPPPPPVNQGQPQKHELPSPPQPSQSQPQIQEPQPPTPMEPKMDSAPEWHEVKKLPQRKQYSIFTPIDESRSILSQHLAAFRGESIKSDPPSSNGPGGSNNGSNKSNANGGNSISYAGDSGARAGASTSPPMNKSVDSAAAQMPQPKPRVSIGSIPETMFTPPSRQNSLRPGGPARPRLRVEIPPDGSEDNSAAGTGGSASSPRNASDVGPLGARRNGEPHTGIVLPPPSPSASALLSAGASGPPNPFARPVPHQNGSTNSMHIDTPGSALPSRFLNNELYPSPSSFYPDWGFGRGSDNNTLPSTLNFATPVVGTGPSFLRDDHIVSNKRKSPDVSAGAPSSDPIDHSNEPKRVKVDS